jgi:hypothetical protein
MHTDTRGELYARRRAKVEKVRWPPQTETARGQNRIFIKNRFGCRRGMFFSATFGSANSNSFRLKVTAFKFDPV